MTDTAPRQKRPPTIHDVAAHAGVSRGTVSRVLQGGHNVSPASHQAVDAAIRKLGYVVNRAARSLVTRRAGSVAFLLSETHERLFQDPNLATLLRGCTTALAAHDIPLVLIAAGTEAERRRIAPYLAAHQVDGVLLFTSHRGTPMIELLQQAELPFVCCGKPHDQAGAVSYVVADDREGARTMMRHLIDSGRRRIATIAGPADGPGGLERLHGYREMLAEHGIRYNKSLVATGDYSRASGESCMRELLARVPDLDAVFVASDLMAEGALSAIERAGLSVPGDIAVGSFDDSPVATATNPPLTTMRQPWQRISDMMVRQLLAQIEGDGPASVILPTELVVRESA
ncbi:LacI family transcriptional regulator [Kribbella voronezhensis]|uniref:LacI family transcriptional regulator n=1 Tax=Kribbella voronezhensis TaxID=2512212 RepID=A0A4V3FJX2_9ACTN|nr:LacI family DNA-binding transcriptional regulator [Kribbella voronezhensis]TDU87973.1 LacI family transcriptional regulator [Kribbella voronezhensis]